MRACGGEIGDLVHRHQPFKLGLDLVDHRWRAVGYDGDAADRVIFGNVGHGEAVDVVTARGEQPGDLGKDPRLVVDGDSKDVALGGGFGNLQGHVRFLNQRLGFVVHRPVDLVAVEDHVGMRRA